MKRLIKIIGAVVAVALAVIVGRAALHLGVAWWRDPAAAIPLPPVGRGDASFLAAVAPGQAMEVIAVEREVAAAEAQLAAVVRRAAREGRKIAIAGAQHAMGGHTLYPGGLVVDMTPFNRLEVDEETRVLTAGAGARWSEVIPFLDRHGLAVKIMQSNNDFTVGGSISVNCHGWQHNAPPISSTVESLRLLKADGEIVTCGRAADQNPELFTHVLGGYGLFGIILDVKLRVVPNEFYRAKSRRVSPAGYASLYKQLTFGRPEVGMAYGRISVAPGMFLDEAIITVLERRSAERSVRNTLRAGEEPSALKRLVFRGSVASDYGKDLRWWLEKVVGETGGAALSRNEIMDEPSSWFANRDPRATEVLHEYFVPVDGLERFLTAMRALWAEAAVRPDLLNITVRQVLPDEDTVLHYTRGEVFGLVMLFHQKRDDDAAESAMKALTRRLIDAAHACGGAYYLPYRPHATREQFVKVYPRAGDFFAAKRGWDPAEIFQNEFYRAFRPLAPHGASR